MPPPSQTIDANASGDDDIYDIEKLLAAAEAEDNPRISQTPQLRDDASFAAAFGQSEEVTNTALPPAAVHSDTTDSTKKAEELDSSDDEDVRNFLDRKYNEYGRDINKKLKQQNDEKRESQAEKEVERAVKQSKPVESTRPTITPTRTQTNSFKARPLVQTQLTATIPRSTVYTDPIFGLRIINPLISSSVLVERMSGRQPVHFSAIPFHTQRGDLSKDWVIAGTIVSKSPVKSTKKGTPFSIWKLSDLRGEIKTISLFLFQNAHKELWKTAQGMVVAILNPSVFDKREERGDIACLSIDTSQKAMILGQSKDLGTCRSKKKNGEPCTAIVNLNDCEFCVFHIKQEFGKMSKRSELQSSTAGRGLAELRNKVLGKSEVFYGGQSYTAVPARKSAKQTARDQQLLMGLSEYSVSPNAGSVNHTSSPRVVKQVPYASRVGPVSKIAAGVEANTKQRLKDLERLKELQKQQTKTPEPDPKPTVELAGKSLMPQTVPDKFKDREFSFTQKSPQLSKDNFSFEVNVPAKQAESAKLKALAVLKNKPLAKSNPNFIKYRGSNEAVKKRAIDDLNDSYNTDAKRRKIHDDQREADRKTRIQKIMEASSSHTNLIQSREQEEQDKYFNKLEKKEALEEKMLSTFKVPCKAVICLQCKYTSFSAADRCKEEKHPLKVINTEKRFFECKDCGNRTVTVHKLPKICCKNCKGSRWQRAAMIREKKTADPKDSLSIRGDEEMFMGSLATKGNLNLLVPDE